MPVLAGRLVDFSTRYLPNPLVMMTSTWLSSRSSVLMMLLLTTWASTIVMRVELIHNAKTQQQLLFPVTCQWSASTRMWSCRVQKAIQAHFTQQMISTHNLFCQCELLISTQFYNMEGKSSTQRGRSLLLLANWKSPTFQTFIIFYHQIIANL